MKSLDWSSLRGTLDYRDGSTPHHLDPTIPISTEAIKLDFTVDPCPLGHKVTLTLLPQRPITVEHLAFTLDVDELTTARLFVNGYQSWTDSFEHASSDRLPVLTKPARFLTRKFRVDAYSDVTWMNHPHGKGQFSGYTLAYCRWGQDYCLIGSLSEDSGFTIIDLNVSQGTVRLRKDLSGITLSSPLTMTWVILEGQRNAVFDAYFELQGIPKPSTPIRSGWTSWYHYYQAISEPIILKNLEAFSQLHPHQGIFQIDDGYQAAIGDWLTIDQTKFPNGMKPIADAIHAKGHLAGIWLAPFVAEQNSTLFRDHPAWFLKDAKGQPVCAGGNWSGAYALDLELIEVKDYLRKVFRTVLDDWGYDLVKLDFLYAACMGTHPTKSRGQRMGEAMRFLRELVGKKLILGCGVPLGSAFGLVDYCRIGPDVGLDWEGPWFHRYLHRERVSTHTAIRNAFGRSVLDHRAFLNDPDVFLLRDEGVQLNPNQRELLSRVNELMGSLLFTSDDVSVYDATQQAQFLRTTANTPVIITEVEDDDGFITVRFSRNGEAKRACFNVTDHPVIIDGKTILPYQSVEELA